MNPDALAAIRAGKRGVHVQLKDGSGPVMEAYAAMGDHDNPIVFGRLLNGAAGAQARADDLVALERTYEQIEIETPCPRCEGSGTVWAYPDKAATCGVCHGTGLA